MPVEIELKLALPPDARRAFLRHPLLAGATQTLTARKLENTYFDTPDLDLRKRGIALRLRRQGRQWLQTVKCAGIVAGGLSTRPEWEQPFVNDAFDFSGIGDEKVRKALERAQRRRRLAPVFETTFTRRTWRFEQGSGEAMLLVLDRGAIAANGRRETISEIEIELESGATEPMFRLARALAACLPLRLEPLSKAERGYRLVRGETSQPVRAGKSPLDGKQSPVQAFQAVALDCLAQFQGNERGALTSDDPEFIHQMRVALRRLRSALRLFAPALPAGFAAPLLPPLRELAGALGGARDWDVLIDELLDPVCAAFAGDARLAALHEAADRQRELARQRARLALQGPGQGRLLLDLTAALHRPELCAAAADAGELRAFAGRRLRKLRRRAAALAERASSLDITALHALRVGVKRLRYGLEFFAPLYRGKSVKAEIAMLARLQVKLGMINDLANAGRLLGECIGADAQLREALALMGGWYGPRYEALRGELPARITAVAQREGRKRGS